MSVSKTAAKPGPKPGPRKSKVLPDTAEAIEARTETKLTKAVAQVELKIEQLRSEMKDTVKDMKIWYLASVISIAALLYFRV